MLNHYATMVKSLVILMDSTLYIDPGQDIHDTRYPLAGVGRPARSSTAPSSGHDVTGPDINLDFPEAHFGCTARLGSSNVASDRRQTEK